MIGDAGDIDDVDGQATDATAGCNVLERCPMSLDGLIGWFGLLTWEQLDRVWVAALADVLTRGDVSIGGLLDVARYVRARYLVEISRIAAASNADREAREARLKVNRLVADLKRSDACSMGWAKRRKRISAAAIESMVVARLAGGDQVEFGAGDPPAPGRAG